MIIIILIRQYDVVQYSYMYIIYSYYFYICISVFDHWLWKVESFNLNDKSVVDSLKSVVYLRGDVIYKAGTESDCMYFIASGTVALITFAGKEVSIWKHTHIYIYI